MNIRDEIEKLPDTPSRPIECYRQDEREWWYECWLVRYRTELALARKWISTTHQPDCAAARSMEFWPVIPIDPCTCGRDVLLAAITPPGEKDST